MTIDNRRQEFRLRAVVVARWSSFSIFHTGDSTDAPVTFLGTSRPEGVSFTLPLGWKVDVRMRGGRDRVLVFPTVRRNRLTAGGHGAPLSRYDGGRGADVVKGYHSPAVIYGSGGNDHLTGSTGNDILIGGQGRDVADGSDGFDRCRAEVLTHCEF